MFQRLFHWGSLLIVLGTAAAAGAQEPASPPFNCELGAVEIIVDREPALTIVPLAMRPRVPQSPSHEFTFTGAPFGIVRVCPVPVVIDPDGRVRPRPKQN